MEVWRRWIIVGGSVDGIEVERVMVEECGMLGGDEGERDVRGNVMDGKGMMMEGNSVWMR